MGQTQILLIVIGAMVVGISIIVGINLASNFARNANRDAVINDINNIAVYAKQYYHKPVALGGGGNSYINFTTPPHMDTTENGTYFAIGLSGNLLIIIGTGNEIGNDGTTKVRVIGLANPNSVTTLIAN
ncbi:MAG: hypothetical protein N3F03_00025 [Ignavibacteria bacterium]|nr:hypothetical protein [Ignavibacteria bacterium]